MSKAHFPNLHTGFEDDDVISGKTSERISKEVFGDLNDDNLFNDIFGIPKKPKKKHTEVDYKNEGAFD